MPKINTNQAKRVAFLMRSSVSVLTGSYVKKTIDSQQVTAQPEPQPRAEIEHEITKTDKLRDRREYLKAYYEANKEKIIDSIKVNDKAKYFLRHVRELNNGIKLWEKVRNITREKYKLEYNDKLKKYVSNM